jgi:hypothetical protein
MYRVKGYVHGTAPGPPLGPERMREIERAILRAIGVPVPLPDRYAGSCVMIAAIAAASAAGGAPQPAR